MEEWSEERIRHIGRRVVDFVARYLSTVSERRVFTPVPAELVRVFEEAAWPQHGTNADELLDEFIALIAPYPFGNGHPRFWGWVNSPPEVMGVFAELLAATMNPSCAGGNHAAVHVERMVIRWFSEIVGFPGPEAGSGGLLVSGGTMATVSALAIARNVAYGGRARTQGEGAGRGVVYTSEEGHGCIRKAVELLGIGSDHLRSIPCDEHFRIELDRLERALIEDRGRGLTPIAVVASAGMVNTGAIDPLDAIADLCARERVWLHIDGAYGAPAILSNAYREPLAAMARADSIAIDPHKWLYVPVEAGMVLVRDRQAMRDTFSLVPPYLRTDGNAEGVGGPVWFSEYGLQQTRGFRALKVWMAMKTRGLEGYRQAIEGDLARAARLVSQVREHEELELGAPPGLGIVCFRYVPKASKASAESVDEVNRRLVEALQLGGEVFLSSTVLRERFLLRACFVNPLTTDADVDMLVELTVATGRRIAQGRAADGA
ncbi:MAG TPA: pyridoxal-dependent decarboxylase [Polyangiaceae bacterium]|nr:pyridoxal-dependent decarboxylase [Polyangiaceae bacterium]